jgi:acyl-CoA synthetase (AMP-forming)/AMP-acid ligase II
MSTTAAGATLEVSRTVGAVLRGRAEGDADHIFLVCDSDRVTYRQLWEASTPLARQLLAAGVVRGTHVALLLPNGIDIAAWVAAVLRIGAVAVPIATTSSVAELRTILDSSDSEVLIAIDSYRGRSYADAVNQATADAATPVLRRVVSIQPGSSLSASVNAADDVRDELLAAVEADVCPADVAVIVHTSGSTSAPKGVVHTHGALIDHLRVLNGIRDYTPDDVLFSNSPFFWIGGFAYTLLGTLLAGATLLTSAAVDPGDVLDLIERERPNRCNGYASSAVPLAAHPSFPDRDFSFLRRGNLYPIMPADVCPTDPQLRPGMLGMTEGGSVVMTHTDEDADLPEYLRGTFGAPTPDLQGRIVDRGAGTDAAIGEQGELWLRGPALMQGYYGLEREPAFDADGWFHTGDLVHVDADGFWFFHGRGDDMIKTAGANVSPAEVQAAILSATGLVSYVIGVPDPERGHVVAAALVVPAGTEAPDAAQLREQLSTLLSGYKIPRVVRGVTAEQVPLRSSGKLDTTRLRELLDA